MPVPRHLLAISAVQAFAEIARLALEHNLPPSERDGEMRAGVCVCGMGLLPVVLDPSTTAFHSRSGGRTHNACPLLADTLELPFPYHGVCISPYLVVWFTPHAVVLCWSMAQW